MILLKVKIYIYCESVGKNKSQEDKQSNVKLDYVVWV